MELLRLVAMLLVLILHADFLSLGTPQQAEAESNPFGTFIRLFVEASAIPCVNIFVLLSGWYGIKIRKNRLLEFLFQVAFITMLSIVVNIMFFEHRFCVDDIKNLFMLKMDILWFPKSYLLLYLMSPIINAFIDNTNKKNFFVVLICMIGFQLIYGWVFDAVGWYRGGYSTIFFIELYMLARYCRLHFGNRIKDFPIRFFVLAYVLCMLCVAAIWYIAVTKGINLNRIFNVYTSPFAIIGALLLVLGFSKIQYRNQLVNWIASSCFAVYLCNCAPGMLSQYAKAIRQWHENNSTVTFFFYTSFLIVALFVGAILIDKLRMQLWRFIIFCSNIKR